MAGKYSDAIANFSEYLKKPTRDKAMDVEVFYLRALSYYKSNNYNRAIEDFQETILLDHKNKGNIYWFLAKCHEKNNNLPETLNAYNNALRELEGNKDSRCKLLYERSQVHKRMNSLPLAYADLRTLVALQPTHAEAKREFDALEKQGIKAPAPVAVASNQPVASIDTDHDKLEEAKVAASRAKNEKPTVKNKPVPKETKSVVPAANTTPVVSYTAPEKPSLADFYKNEKRYALVIGNSNYPKNVGVLRNPVNDATDFAKELENSNFEVQLLTNATYGQMRAAMLKFKEKVDHGDKDNTVSLFYYAGHGLQRDQENYLVPVDAAIEFEDDIARYCFPVQRMVLSNMERSNSRMNIVILDACRNNPFPALNRGIGEESGLGEMRRAMGSFIAYATAPGSVASDGTGRNGLYTQELLKAVRKPGLTIEQVFKEVRQNVLRMSGNKQNTWDSSNIIGEFYFKF
jgi:tetratricopeptide (TPR) repeat protein